MENSNIAESMPQKEALKKSREYNIIVIVVTLALLGYFYFLIFGTSSAMVLLDIEAKKEKLDREYNKLQDQNQKLQKKYFELIQLTPDEDLF